MNTVYTDKLNSLRIKAFHEYLDWLEEMIAQIPGVHHVETIRQNEGLFTSSNTKLGFRFEDFSFIGAFSSTGATLHGVLLFDPDSKFDVRTMMYGSHNKELVVIMPEIRRTSSLAKHLTSVVKKFQRP